MFSSATTGVAVSTTGDRDWAPPVAYKISRPKYCRFHQTLVMHI